MKLSSSIISSVHAIWQKKGLISTLMLPLAWVTGRVVAARKRRAQALPTKLAPPTIVVGNLLVGGTGKTPVVIAVIKSLQARGWTPGVVSRGYGVQIGPEPRSGQGELAAADFGDEPSLIAASTGAAIAVHPQRDLARQALAANFPRVDVVVSDDGLQHLALSRDVEIIVQDARGIGNGRLLPAGPLREPASKLAEVDFIIDNSTAPNAGPPLQDDAQRSVEQVAMRLQPTFAENLGNGERVAWPEWVLRHRHRPIAAVAAIGQPTRFFDTLRQAGLKLTLTRALPDHHAYKHSPFPGISEDVIAITAKDGVKCRHVKDPRVWVVHIEAIFSNPAWLDRLEQKLLAVAIAQTNRR
ncbi:tetraacyldisaccharide 4'-kinase [Pusillimonas sp.]|uniref:tetraacyldisaccharide 4'-kinase n=1 Tax=Pusillimonas sp. TaxID=3040095 RepID=UPI0037C9AC52